MLIVQSAMTPPTETELASVSNLLCFGVITSRAALLITLLGQDTAAMTMGDLAEQLKVRIPRVSMLGNTLSKDGLVERIIPAADQRKISLALTQAGYAAARAALNGLRAFSGAA
jgi:DNA-binding MarR family transcriptional regulator